MLALAARMKMDDLVPQRARILPAGALTGYVPAASSPLPRHSLAAGRPSPAFAGQGQHC